MAVVRLEVTKREPYAGGRSFGAAGSYEKVAGRLHLAVDPLHAANAMITGLDHAARDASGLVHFSTAFRLLQPVDPVRGNRNLLFFVVNRGRQAVPFNRPPAEPDPTETLDPGDGFLMRHGWTVSWCGWQWDVIDDPVLIGLDAPEAVGPDGSALGGEIVVMFQPSVHHADQELSHWPQYPAPGHQFHRHRPNPAADVNDPHAVLTVREWAGGPRTVIARDRWQFARDVGGRAVPDPAYLRLHGGFLPGLIYELRYRTSRSPVVGAGFLAMRDCVSFLRHGDGASGNPAAGRIAHTFGFGVSQCGRFLRDYLAFGCNLDESGRPAFDGLLPHVAGARRGEFNHWQAQPSVQHVLGMGHLPPFASAPVPDFPTGLFDRQRALGGLPKVVSTNSSSEYWRIEASLTHTDLAGLRDVPVDPDERLYLFAGTQHGPGAPPLGTGTPYGAAGANSFNTVDYSPLLRSALVHLERWVVVGVTPPPHAVPKLGNGTAITRATALHALGSIPGMAVLHASHAPQLPRFNPGPDSATGHVRVPGDGETGPVYPGYVSALDADGNEVAGWRLPDLTVPLGTHTGWNPRAPHTGGVGQLLDMIGSTVPFPRTEAQRTATRDPRPSIASRYASREEYLRRVDRAITRAIASGWILGEDRGLVTSLADTRWQAFAAGEVATA